MILMPGHNAISVVVPRSPRASLVLAFLLPLLSGVVGQRYASTGRADLNQLTLMSIGRMPSPVSTMSTMSAALGGSLQRAHAMAAKPRPQPQASADVSPAVAAKAAAPEATTTTRQPMAAKVVDVKAMLRTLWGLRRGTISSDEVSRLPRTGTLRLEALHLNESIEVQPFDAQQEPDPAAMAQIGHAMRCRITGTEIAIDTQLVALLTRLHTLYGKPIQLISGHRQPDTIGTKRTSQHTLGKAADIRIPGVSIEELRRVAMKLGARGVGLYPEKGFVHVDMREKVRYSWVYTEARGEQPDFGAPRRAAAARALPAETESESDASEHEVDAEPHTERGQAE
jgi:uncharacterized protein YcbK (DUF882 family)